MSTVKNRQKPRTRDDRAQPFRPGHLWSAALAFALWPIAGAVSATDPAKVDFARDIQPIFIKRCYECHGPDKQKSGLRLDRKSDALKGGKSGKPLLVGGKSAESEIIQ